MSIRTLLKNRMVAAAIVVVLITAAALGGLVGKSRAHALYESTAIVMVLPPGAGNPNATMNPFVNLDSRIVQLALALTSAMNSPDAMASIGPPNPALTKLSVDTVKTSLSSADAGNTVQIQFTAQATDPAVASFYAKALSNSAGARLHDMQRSAGVTGATFASLVEVASASPPQAISASKMRTIMTSAFIAFACAALLVALILAAWARVAPRLRVRKRGANEPQHTDDAPTPSDDDWLDTYDPAFDSTMMWRQGDSAATDVAANEATEADEPEPETAESVLEKDSSPSDTQDSSTRYRRFASARSAESTTQSS